MNRPYPAPAFLNTLSLPSLFGLWACLLVALVLATAPARAEEVVDAAAMSEQPLSLTDALGLLEDPQARYGLDDVRSPPLAERFEGGRAPANALALGFTRSAFWLRVALHNPGDVPLRRMLVVDNPRVSQVDAFLPDGQGGYRAVLTGSDRPFDTRLYPNRNFVFPLLLAPGETQVVYLRVASKIGLLVPLKLWDEAAFHVAEREDYAIQAWYFGIATAMILFNLLLFAVLRDRTYLFYVIYVGLMMLGLASKNGLAPESPWDALLLNSNEAYYSGVSLALVGMLLFTRRMLQTRESLPRTDRLMLALVGLYLLTPALYWMALPVFARAAVLLNLATALLIVGVAVACAFRRQRTAYFFIGAFALLIAGGTTTILRAIGLLPTNVFTVDGIQLGSAMEMMLLAFALADRYNVMRREKARVKDELLRAQQQLVETLQQSERVLEQRVAERTDELQALNRRLETLSLTDGLTGIANRRHFDVMLSQAWSHAQRNGESLALAVMDVDWFKPYNDHYGHPAGDACLRQVAQALSATLCRSSDLMARYGGEEFVFLAQNSGVEGALGLARRVAEAMEALHLPHERSPLGHVTLSIGVAAMVPQPGQLPEVLLQRADAALYEAKRGGRNQVVVDG